MTATAALPSPTLPGRIAHASADKQGMQAAGPADGDSFATVLAGTTAGNGSASGSPAGAATATTVSTAPTHLSQLIAAASGETEAEAVASDADSAAVTEDASHILPVAAAQTNVVTAAAPQISPGTALVMDGETGDAANPAGDGLEGAGVAPAAASPAGAAAAGAIAGTAFPTSPDRAASNAGVTAAISPAGAAATAEPEIAADGLEAVDADGDTRSAATSGQTPSKASASTSVGSPASATNPNAAASTAMTAGADIAVDPAAGAQAKAATTVEAATALTAAPQESARAAATPAAAQAAMPAATVQVYTRMIERFDGRAQRFEVRLDPAELGRVDVRIEIGADKKVHAVLAAHDSAALNDLMRGHRALERALADAGIDLADGGVRFELASDSNRNTSTGERDSRAPASPNVWRSFETTNPSAEAAVKPVAQPWRPARLDLVA